MGATQEIRWILKPSRQKDSSIQQQCRCRFLDLVLHFLTSRRRLVPEILFKFLVQGFLLPTQQVLPAVL
jgi:hypothetical protein